MQVRDYNGPGEWSADAIRKRYHEYCRRFKQTEATTLAAREHRKGDILWRYPVMDAVVDGIKAGDRACVELGVEFVESGHKQPFGRILHANVARALKRSALNRDQVGRLRRRILHMLVVGQVPHEYRAFANLLRHIGLGPSWPEQRRLVDESNKYVMRYVRYFEALDRSDRDV